MCAYNCNLDCVEKYIYTRIHQDSNSKWWLTYKSHAPHYSVQCALRRDESMPIKGDHRTGQPATNNSKLLSFLI